MHMLACANWDVTLVVFHFGVFGIKASTGVLSLFYHLEETSLVLVSTVFIALDETFAYI